MKRFLFSLVIVILAASITLAQDRRQILDRIESNVIQNLPGFTLKHRILGDQNASYVWVHGEEFVYVEIEFHQSTDHARGAFVSRPWVARSEGMGEVDVPDERLSGLGYDNFWSEDRATKKRGLQFYRGHVSVMVTAPSNQLMERIARQIDLMLPDA